MIENFTSNYFPSKIVCGLLQNKLLREQAMRSLHEEMIMRPQKFQILTLKKAWQLRLNNITNNKNNQKMLLPKYCQNIVTYS